MSSFKTDLWLRLLKLIWNIKKDSNEEDDSESESDEDEDEDDQKAELEAALIKHNGCVNRIKVSS